MTIAPKVQQALDALRADYEIIEHSPSRSALENAQFGHVPPERLAKAVLLDRQAEDRLLAVLPSDRRIELSELREALGEKPRLADEAEIAEVFDDCAVGAIPPIGWDYGVTMIVDDSLANQPDVYFEGGDHRSLIHMEQADFARLTQSAHHGTFSERWVDTD